MMELPAVGIFISFTLLLQPLKASLDACAHSRNPDICLSSLRVLGFDPSDNSAKVHDKAHLALAGVDSALASVQPMLASIRVLSSRVASPSHAREKAALRDCVELIQDASRLLIHSHKTIRSHYQETESLENAHTWMSAALTYHTTCVDGIHAAGSGNLRHSKKFEKSLSAALSLIAELRASKISRSTPEWVSKTIGNYTILPNITVSQDGSGQFTTITAALAATPIKSKSRFVIYIKAGIYKETFEVPRIQNLMFLGDGIDKTIITGNKSVQDPNVTTYSSATVAIKADNFIAQDITFENTAGAINHQAVAVRVSADKVAFFRCSFLGFQDTLYAHSLRQFYTECDIYGTVDFIFGNAAASFQNCNLRARLPLPQQKNVYTAQGRTDPSQNTGFVFQSCYLDGTPELKANISQFPTYLGRPWKEYSLTVFIKCYESEVVNPAGWLEWSGDFALQTLFYGEYFCYGAGGASSSRVDWSTQIYDASFAEQYTTANLVNGNDWLPGTGLPFTLG